MRQVTTPEGRAVDVARIAFGVGVPEVSVDQTRVVKSDGSETDDELTLHAPEPVRLKETEDGADEVLEIESESLTTLLRFRSTVLPEMVDGIS